MPELLVREESLFHIFAGDKINACLMDVCAYMYVLYLGEPERKENISVINVIIFVWFPNKTQTPGTWRP